MKCFLGDFLFKVLCAHFPLNSMGKNHFAIKESDEKRKRFVPNELPLKVTSQYTLIKSESISNGREIYVLCCFPFIVS